MKDQIFALVSIAFSGASAAQISCPRLSCDTLQKSGPVTYDMCWKSDDQQPMANMMSVDCSWYQNIEKSNYDVAVKTTCDMSLLSNEFAWVDETTQHEGASEQAQSQFRQRKTEAYCKEVDAFKKNLNNGRSCSQHNQCISGNCQDQFCTGLKLGEHCNKHTDCNAAMFCN